MEKQTSNDKKRPLGVLLIAVFYIFGALVLVINIFTNPVGASQAIAKVHGLSSVMGVEVLVAVAALALVLAYGLISLSRWGFVLSVAYLVYFAGVNLAQGGLRFIWTGRPELGVFFGNILWSVLVMLYLFLVRHRFSGKRFKESRQ